MLYIFSANQKIKIMTTRATTSIEKEAMTFLNGLRESGITNMFGASPYVDEMFNTGAAEAKRILVLWMANFNDEGNYNTVSV
jgi:hypothetical protein